MGIIFAVLGEFGKRGDKKIPLLPGKIPRAAKG
jgi:hypothetical protein